jgi:hypothetical protein
MGPILLAKNSYDIENNNDYVKSKLNEVTLHDDDYVD